MLVTRSKIPMKTTLLLSLAALIYPSLALAEQTLNYPKKNPLVTFSAPDDWKAQMKNGSLFVVSPDGGDVIVEVMTMEAAIDDDAAAVKEARGTVNQDFKNLKLTKTEPAEANGLVVRLLGGEGEDDTGPAHINMALIKHPDASNQILFSLIASKDKAAEYGEACGAMLNSISAAAAAKPAAKAPAVGKVQTFGYPDKSSPEFAVDFPADWKMEPNDEGVYVESPDKLIAMNVLMIDVSDVGVALDSMKKKIGGTYKSIVWNEGGEAEINKDEALGLTATFDNAVAMDEDVKYSVNFVQYVRKGSSKFLLLFSQQPLKALEKHGDALTNIIRSIKVKNQ